MPAEKASARRSKLSGETIHWSVPRPGYQQGKRQCRWQVANDVPVTTGLSHPTQDEEETVVTKGNLYEF
ncbi:hypothetical protein R6Q59_036989 [Mikania micrantha]